MTVNAHAMMNPRVWASLFTCAARGRFDEEGLLSAAEREELPDAIAVPPDRVSAFHRPLDAVFSSNATPTRSISSAKDVVGLGR